MDAAQLAGVNMKLNQLIAVLQTVKQNVTKAKTDVYHQIQKAPLFQGLSRTFQPRDEDGYVYPAESQKLTLKASDLLEQFSVACSEYFNLAASQDWANTQAKADIVIDNETILTGVPVSYLLFLEKQLQDVKTFVQSLPTLAIDKDWRYDAGRGCYVTDPKETVKTKKITDFVVAYDATPEHPAQIKEVSKDVIEGVWSLVEFSGALPQDRVNELLKRVDKLTQAVIKAREEANSRDVVIQATAENIFGYLFR